MITLFTTEECPQCKALKAKLKQHNIEYEVGDLQEIINLGFQSVPIMKIDNEYLNFMSSIRYLSEVK